MWKVLESTPSKSVTLWWNYALAFRQQCKSSEGNFNQACSEKVRNCSLLSKLTASELRSEPHVLDRHTVPPAIKYVSQEGCNVC